MREAIVDTLPYFVGVTGPEEATLRRQALAARRALMSAERDLAIAREEDLNYDSRIEALIQEARELRLIEAMPDADPINVLRTALTVRPDSEESAEIDDDSDSSRASLLLSRRELRRQLRQIDDELQLVRQVMSEEGDVPTEAEIQVSRLNALNLLTTSDGVDTQVCPLCTQALRGQILQRRIFYPFRGLLD